jgi:integrase
VSTYQDKTKRWRYRWQERQADGSILKASGTPRINTRVGAEEAQRLAIAEARKGPTPEPEPGKSVPTFGEFSRTFMTTYAATNNKPSERAAKESILRVHLLPVFADRSLDAITTHSVEELKARLLKSAENKTGLSAKRINNLLHVLSKILKYAMDLEIVDRLPRMKTLKVAPQKFDFLTQEELVKLVEAAESEPMWLAAILLGGDAGLRLGELQGLRWIDVDTKRGQLQVMQSNWRGQIGSPKGGRERTIPLTTRLVEVLREVRHLRGPLVLCRDDGALLSNTNMRAAMKRVTKRAGLRRIGWHVLRHTFCSHLAMRGAAAKAIQDLAGHASIAVTNRYMHLAPGALRSAIDLLEASGA